MDAKITLSFNKEIIDNAKAYAKAHNISLSRLTEFILQKITSEEYQNLHDFPVADWVNQVAEGKVEYKKRGRKSMKDEFMNSRK
ncbi:MAG: hypothetical protein ACJAQ4_002507 [Cryomorphaceae bacterium]|jgi:hypothetical protein